MIKSTRLVIINLKDEVGANLTKSVVFPNFEVLDTYKGFTIYYIEREVDTSLRSVTGDLMVPKPKTNKIYLLDTSQFSSTQSDWLITNKFETIVASIDSMRAQFEFENLKFGTAQKVEKPDGPQDPHGRILVDIDDAADRKAV